MIGFFTRDRFCFVARLCSALQPFAATTQLPSAVRYRRGRYTVLIAEAVHFWRIGGEIVAIKVTGLGDLQRDLEQASQALEAVGGELTTVKFNPNDPSSVDLAIADVEAAIDAKVASFRGNAIVEQFVEGIKKQYRTELLDRASSERLKNGATPMASTNIDPTILRQIENVVSDLRNSEYQSFGKHVKKLSPLLHSPELEPATARLTKDIDLEGWLKAGEDTKGGMVGSATLEWPSAYERMIDKELRDLEAY